MKYADFEKAVSSARMQKYLISCGHNTRKAMTLYRANLRMSTNFFSILSLFEIALRNSIDAHYKKNIGNNWLRNAVQHPSGFLLLSGCERSREKVNQIIISLGSRYTHDKAISSLTFGFWTSLFSSKEFAAAGSTLLKMLPNRPFNTNHTQVYKKLRNINIVRNRIAHHEPLCFTYPIRISTREIAENYRQIMEFLDWMGIDPKTYLHGAHKFDTERNSIDQL